MLVAVATGATVMSSHKTPQIFSRRSEERPVGTFAQHRKQGPQGVLHIPGKPRSAPGAAADALGTAYCNAAGSIVAEASGITTEASEKKVPSATHSGAADGMASGKNGSCYSISIRTASVATVCP